jgi:shikimate dehydrogenase
MMNAAFIFHGIDAVYLSFSVKPQDLKNVMRALRIMNVSGMNITAPYKEVILEYLDDVTPRVNTAGSVNVIINRAGRFIGHNTDGVGFVEAVKNDLSTSLREKRVLIFGAGGSARGILTALLEEEVSSITIANRTAERAQKLAETFEGISLVPLEPKVITPMVSGSEFDVLINTTGIAATDVDFLGIDLLGLKSGTIFFDINYGANQDMLSDQLREKGVLYSDGIAMLFYQGAENFSLWTGERPPFAVMKKALGITNK